MMECQWCEEDIKQITKLVGHTIQTIYPKYYPKEVVEFFCKLHCQENITKDIENGLVSILQNDNILIGTGSFNENHLTFSEK